MFVVDRFALLSRYSVPSACELFFPPPFVFALYLDCAVTVFTRPAKLMGTSTTGCTIRFLILALDMFHRRVLLASFSRPEVQLYATAITFLLLLDLKTSSTMADLKDWSLPM